MDTYSVEIWGQTYEMRANFGEAASPIQFRRYEDEDEDWLGTGKQVADYSYSPAAAMRDYLEGLARESGDDPDEDEDVAADIEQAVLEMQYRVGR